jgi:hypothetical protein
MRNEDVHLALATFVYNHQYLEGTLKVLPSPTPPLVANVLGPFKEYHFQEPFPL